MKKILITGANSQVGSFIAREYESEGRPLILFYHNNDQRIANLESRKYAVDLKDYAALEELLAKQDEEVGALIHCAAVRDEGAKAVADTDPEVFQRVFDDNFLPAYHVLRLVLPRMRSQGFGRVVLFSSDVTRSGLANGSAYSSSKAAIANLAKCAALENAGHNVLVNCIAPGPIDTVLEEDFNGHYLEFRRAYFAKHLVATAAKRLVSRLEIKQLVDLLISSDVRTICGEEIYLSGGKL